MQQWEYLFIAAQYERAEWRPRYVNGQELEDWADGPTLYEFANQLGAVGWELVSAPYTLSEFAAEAVLIPRLVFKRTRHR